MISFCRTQTDEWIYKGKDSIEEWIHKEVMHFKRPVFFTGHYKNQILKNHLHKDELCFRNNRSFFKNLHKKVYVRSKTKLRRFVYLEKQNRVHTHMVLETPQHISVDRFCKFIELSWKETSGGIDPDTKVIYDTESLSGYAWKTKDLEKFCVDIENCKLQSSIFKSVSA